MGFKCILDGLNKYSFEFEDDDWCSLKENYSKRTLVSPCCSTPFIPKENTLGTRFFAHKSLNDCPYSDKTPKEQMYFKYLVARSLVNLGWKISLDKEFQADNGEMWAADIYAEKNNQKFILEILWKDLTESSINTRLDHYQNASIRSLWMLFKAPSKGIPYTAHKSLCERHIAAFLFDYSKKDQVFKVYHIFKPIPKPTPSYATLSIELTDFIKKLFSNKIHVFGLPKRKYNLSLVLSPQTCFQCNQVTNIIQNVCYSLTHQNNIFRLWAAQVCEIPSEHIDTLNEYTEFREHFKFGKINYELNIEGIATKVKTTCFHCGFVNDNGLNISFFSTKNLFESQSIEVEIPTTYKENPRSFALD